MKRHYISDFKNDTYHAVDSDEQDLNILCKQIDTALGHDRWSFIEMGEPLELTALAAH